jgi:diaminopimelate epimerase
MITFSKMHGLGNDFVVLDARHEALTVDRSLLRRIGDRHRGIGCDQLVLLEPSSIADSAVRFYNADGSEAGACGNATRCVAGLISSETGRVEISLETKAGMLAAKVASDGLVTVAMPAPDFAWDTVPLREAGDTLAVDLGIEGLPPATCLSVGNPHAVFFVDDVDRVEQLGPIVQRHQMFPDSVNVGFARQIDRGRLRLRVFERGSGLTLACGSGACAAMAAAVRHGRVSGRTVLVLDGGELEMSWHGEGPIYMSGGWAMSFTGQFDPATIGL